MAEKFKKAPLGPLINSCENFREDLAECREDYDSLLAIMKVSFELADYRRDIHWSTSDNDMPQALLKYKKIINRANMHIGDDVEIVERSKFIRNPDVITRKFKEVVHLAEIDVACFEDEERCFQCLRVHRNMDEK
jgi:hypothetical protein